MPALGDEFQEIRIGRDAGDVYRRSSGEPLHHDLENDDTLYRLRESMGSDVFAAQYEQKPMPAGGAMIKRHWLKYYDKAPKRTRA